MKITALLLTGLACFLGPNTFAAGQPRGNLIELHSCELYAGGCTVSSEATLGGRYMLRAWNFADGSFQGTELAGLNLVVLQSGTENLAASKAKPAQAIVYLPANANTAQRAALIAWLKASEPCLGVAGHPETRIVPIQFTRTEAGYALSAGDFLAVKTAPLEECESGACGQALWYTPRSQTSVFTVAVDRSSKVHEPLLQLKWDDAGRRSIFLAKFGEDMRESLFVSTADLCGPSGKL